MHTHSDNDQSNVDHFDLDHFDLDALAQQAGQVSIPTDEQLEAGRRRLQAAIAQADTRIVALRRHRRRPGRRWTGLRWAGLRWAGVGLAAGIAVLGISTSQVLGGDTAYAASWKPAPTPASQADVSAARGACADSAESLVGDQVATLQPRLAERRGDVVLLALDDGARQPVVLMCLVGLRAGDEATFHGGSGGAGVVRPAADAISEAGIYEVSTPGDELSVINGLAGEDVAAVTAHAPDGRVVRATVEDGHYAAWWPGTAQRKPTQPFRAGAEGDCAGGCDGTYWVPEFTLDVTLKNGTLKNGTLLHDVSDASF